MESPMCRPFNIDVRHNQQYQLLHLFLEVDGRWGEWEEWSTCDNCGRGWKERNRKCIVKGRGKPCHGNDHEKQTGMIRLFDSNIKLIFGFYIVQHKIINLYILYLQFQSIVIGAAGVNGMSARRLVMRDQDRDIAK